MWKRILGVEFIYNSRDFQPNSFGEQMLKTSVNSYTIYGVTDNVHMIDLQKNIATSEEEWLGLGL